MALAVLPAVAVVVLTLLPGAPVARGHEATQAGGAAAPDRPQVEDLRCRTGDETTCARGDLLRIGGEYLRSSREVVFLGRRGAKDDRRARVRKASPHRVLVEVPATARSGRLRVLTAEGDLSNKGPRLKVVRQQPSAERAPAATGTASSGVFPIRGRHDYGTATNRFGGGRGHEGQDVFAKCGTPLVAAVAGTVKLARFQSAAGNYVVVETAEGTSHVYMHLKAPATVAKGDTVAAGDPLGQVGDTGRASGCHLHFELWTAPGWYEGGEPIDPLPFLRSLDAQD